MQSSCRNRDRPLSRCDTPSLVTSTSEDIDCCGKNSVDLGDFPGDFDSSLEVVEHSADTESKKTSERSNSPFEEKKTRQFQRWTPIEDHLLQGGIKMGGGPPHDWKTIAANHLSGTRSAIQVSLLALSMIYFQSLINIINVYLVQGKMEECSLSRY